ncbi:MAG: ATP-dependent Clp protease proteolytic subunit [Alphaproteobacteria bacterium]|nr:ATP-dependent Clp protease proteolytic subunit [Alphaproteobacteria bacterium]
MLDEGDKKDEKAESIVPSPVGQALYKARTILIFGEINDKIAERVTAQLLAFSAEGDADIKVIVSSPGGHVESGDVIHDMIQFVKPRVVMIGSGWVASAGAHIFLGAKKENRYCLPNTRFMLHQPLGGVRGQASDIQIEAEEIIKMRKRINAIIARETGQPIEKVDIDTDRNFWMGPKDAKEYGIVTHIIDNIADIK